MKLNKEIELPGQILLSWFNAGAIGAGGFLVAYGTLSEQLSYYLILYTVAGLFIFGGLLGFFLGGALGMFGRPLAMRITEAFSDQLHTLLYILPSIAIGFVIAGWIGLTYWALYSLNWLAILFTATAWFIGAAVVAVAINKGWLGLKNLGIRIKRLANIRIRIDFGEE